MEPQNRLCVSVFYNEVAPTEPKPWVNFVNFPLIILHVTDTVNHTNLSFFFFHSVPEGTSITESVFTGIPKSGVPSLFHVNGCILGDRLLPQPSPGLLLA